MNPDPRWVFDTNAIVSAMLFKASVPRSAFREARKCGQILVSEATAAELTKVVKRDKFDRYLTRQEREQFLVRLLREGTIVDISEEIHACRDAKDDKFLELAVNGKALCLISGDADLLILNPFRDIPILTPAQFLEWLPKTKADGD